MLSELLIQQRLPIRVHVLSRNICSGAYEISVPLGALCSPRRERALESRALLKALKVAERVALRQLKPSILSPQHRLGDEDIGSREAVT